MSNSTIIDKEILFNSMPSTTELLCDCRNYVLNNFLWQTKVFIFLVYVYLIFNLIYDWFRPTKNLPQIITIFRFLNYGFIMLFGILATFYYTYTQKMANTFWVFGILFGLCVWGGMIVYYKSIK